MIADNIIIGAGEHGIFCDDRVTTGNGYSFERNTIVSPVKDCLRVYANMTNSAKDNILVAPGKEFVTRSADAQLVEINTYTARNESYVKYLMNRYA